MPFKIIRTNLTKVHADAIVNTANPMPVYGDGTDRAIYMAAGADELLAERRKIGAISRGEAAVTKAFRLPARFIIHTVGPVWQGGDHGEFETLRSCYRKSLFLAEQLGCQSIAFPLISTGVYGFPRDKALDIALSCFREHLKDSEIDIILVVFDRKSFQLSEELVSDVEQFIDEQTVKHQFEMEMPSGSLSYGAEQERREAYRRMFGNSAPLFASDALEESVSPDAFDEEESARPKARRQDVTARDSSEGPDWEERGGPKGSDRAKRAKSAAPKQEKRPKPKTQERPKSSRRGLFDPEIAALFERLKEKQSGHGADLKQGSLEDVMNNIGETFQQRLLRMIDEREYTDAQVYKKALLDRNLFSMIRCKEDYNPSKKTVLALALALELNLDETIDLLARAGYALSPSSKSDLLVEYCIVKEKYDLLDVNALLFHYGLPTLR